jgi:hypothetical protein
MLWPAFETIFPVILPLRSRPSRPRKFAPTTTFMRLIVIRLGPHSHPLWLVLGVFQGQLSRAEIWGCQVTPGSDRHSTRTDPAVEPHRALRTVGLREWPSCPGLSECTVLRSLFLRGAPPERPAALVGERRECAFAGGTRR